MKGSEKRLRIPALSKNAFHMRGRSLVLRRGGTDRPGVEYGGEEG